MILKGLSGAGRKYPRQEDKDEARRAYCALIKSGVVTHAEVFHAILIYAAAVVGVQPRYIKMFANWLKRGCYKNEAPAPAPVSPTNNPREVAAALKRGLFAQRGRP